MLYIPPPPVTLPKPSTPLLAATTCHGKLPCLVPLIPLSFASSPSARNCANTSFNRFSAVALVCTVGVHIKLLVLRSCAGLGLCGIALEARPPALTPSVAGGKGDVAARVEPTAPIQSMFTAVVMGPCEGSGMWWWTELLVAWVSPRLIRRPDMSAGLN